MLIKSVSFFSKENQKIAGDLYLPSDFNSSRAYPALLLCQGLSGIKSLVLPTIAQAFATEGFVCLAFDYRGFGDSEGTRGYIDLVTRSEDAMQAFNFLAHQPFVNPLRIGVYGISLGGGIAAFVGLYQPQTKAVAVVSGFYSGERLLRSLRTAHEWIACKDRLYRNQAAVEKGGLGEEVEIEEIFPFDPSFLKKYQSLKEGQQSESIPQNQANANQWYLSSADRIRAFNVASILGNLAPRPILFIHGERDNVIPIEDVEEAYQLAQDVKQLIVIKDADHIDLDNGSGLERQIGYALEWFKTYLA
jgi:uncharacterized protein